MFVLGYYLHGAMISYCNEMSWTLFHLLNYYNIGSGYKTNAHVCQQFGVF